MLWSVKLSGHRLKRAMVIVVSVLFLVSDTLKNKHNNLFLYFFEIQKGKLYDRFSLL